MQTVVRTVYGSILQTAHLIGLPFNMLANSTLNERFNVQSGVAPLAGVYPKAQYYCIGYGGHQLVLGADNTPLTKVVQHRATDAGLYKPMPFQLVDAANDLAPTERAKYGLRVAETYNGVNYIAYYLKRIPTSLLTVDLKDRTINNGVPTDVAFTPTSSNLVPTPPTLAAIAANLLVSEYIVCTSTLTLSLTDVECAAIVNSAKIIHGDEYYAIISEIGLCSGVDKVIQLGDGSNFNEAIAVQIISHVNTFHSIKFTSGGITGLYDLGVSDVLLAIQ
jgi:hypothetical protein